MSADPAAVLRHFFSVRRSQARLDAAAMARRPRTREALGGVGDTLVTASTTDPAAVAFDLSQRMCRAFAVYIRQVIPRAVRVYVAASAASRVAELAAEAAHATGRLAELDRQAEAIRVREGLGDTEWAVGEGPDDYRAVRDESEKISRQAFDGAFGRALRLYGLGSVAKLYRVDRPRYDRLLEEGRRQLFAGAR